MNKKFKINSWNGKCKVLSKILILQLLLLINRIIIKLQIRQWKVFQVFYCNITRNTSSYFYLASLNWCYTFFLNVDKKVCKSSFESFHSERGIFRFFLFSQFYSVYDFSVLKWLAFKQGLQNRKIISLIWYFIALLILLNLLSLIEKITWLHIT